MTRGDALIVHTIPVYLHTGDTEPINLRHLIEAGGQWHTGPIQHIAIIGPGNLHAEYLKKQFDALTDEQWMCAHTLASDGWHGTPEELIETVKELS